MEVRLLAPALALLLLLLVLATITYTYYLKTPGAPSAIEASVSGGVILVGVATTLYNAGVAQDLVEGFRNASGYSFQAKFLVRGSGDLLRALSDGSICVAFTHAPLLEKSYLERGSIKWWGPVAYNRFVIVGPEDDPAGVRGSPSVVEAFKRIYYAGERGLARFISRGDLSGTHVRELQVWNLSGLKPEVGSWYLRSIRGAPETIIMASNLRAYTFVDEGTFKVLLARGRVSGLSILYEGMEPILLNVYSLITSNHERCRDVGWLTEFINYVKGPGQGVLERYARQGLYYPVAGREAEVYKAWVELTKLGG